MGTGASVAGENGGPSIGGAAGPGVADDYRERDSGRERDGQ